MLRAGVCVAEVFISYSSKDEAAARAFAEALGLEGFTCWYDKRIRGADVWDEIIDREIRAAGVVVTLWTPDAVASRWVRSEADYAFENNKLLPVIVAPCELPLGYRLIQAFKLQTAPGQLRNHANWRDFVARLREFLTANTVATMAARELEEKERQHRARRAKFWRGAAIAGVVVALVAAGGAGALWWQNERASSSVVTVSADGTALSLSNLRARRVGSARLDEAPRLLAIAPLAEAIVAETHGGITVFSRDEAGVWDWGNPVRTDGWTCQDAGDDIPACRFSALYAFGERRTSSSPFTQGMEVVGRLVAAVSYGKELRVWRLRGGVARYGEPLGGCAPSENPPVACNVETFAPDPFESAFMVGLADGSVYYVGTSVTQGSTVLEPESTERRAVLVMRRPGHVPTGIAFGQAGAAAISWDDGQINFYDGEEEDELVSAADNCGPSQLGMSGDAMTIIAMCMPQNVQPYLRRFTRTAWQQPWSLTHTRSSNPVGSGTRIAVTTDARFVIVHGSEIYDLQRNRHTEVDAEGSLRLARLRGRDVLIGFTGRQGTTSENAVSILDPDSVSPLASVPLPVSFGGVAIGFDERDVYAAYMDHSDGNLVLWRLSDPGGPLVQIPTATR